MAGFRELQHQSLQQLRPNCFNQDDSDDFDVVVKIFESMGLPNDTNFTLLKLSGIQVLVAFIQEQTQDEEEQKVEADAELGDGDKERETSKVNERQTLEEEEEQMEVDTEVEEPVQVERQKQGRGNKEQKKSGEKRKDEVHEKNKEKNQDEDGSMSNSEKLDKLIQMIYDLGKRVEVIQNVLGVPDGSSNKQDYENLANFFDDTKGATNDKNEEEVNRGDKRNAADDENDEEICDEEAISAMQQLTKVNTFGENENTKQLTEEIEKIEKESCMKQKSNVTLSSQTFTTPNFDTRVTSLTPTFTTPKFDLLSHESRHSGKSATEVLMRDVGEKFVFQPLMKTKNRLVQQDSQVCLVYEYAEPPLKKKNKADIGDVALRRSERGQIPSIHTQPQFTGYVFQRRKHTLIINKERVNTKWFSHLETPGRNLSKTHIEAGLELLKLRKRNNPDLFLNKTALVVGVKFLEEIDELYDEFLDDKEGFQLESGFDKYNIEKNITFLYSSIAVEEDYWLGIVVNLEKRNITAFNCAALKYTDADMWAYVNAYAMVLPFMIRNIFKDVNMDTSKFAIKGLSEGFPQDDLMNDAPTPTIVTQESSSSTLVLESNEDDMMNGYATEIITPEESYSNTLILEDTDNETPINEPVVAFELPLPHESDDTMNDDASSPIIDAPEIPIANTYQVDVKCILGDPEMHSDLVEDVDIQFGRVVDIVKRGYRLKRQRLD
ncbi:hypothetical protein Bca52824_022914 [Brassica carinata]|uniref:Ubiquitin-like protease family profile domain-containing protein n=1 Tax=Brassica carinata TaxID=52824 RepID=A0A8X7VHK7_BRACI|nr:hypothetical protein Bca52824_022914 [Brassica carinata]